MLSESAEAAELTAGVPLNPGKVVEFIIRNMGVEIAHVDFEDFQSFRSGLESADEVTWRHMAWASLLGGVESTDEVVQVL